MKKYIILMIAIFLIVSCSHSQEKSETETTKSEDTKTVDTSMSFFVTSVNPWKWANFWGLTWADDYCKLLATNAWAWTKSWKAYLSTAATDGNPAVNARDRIWTGPWYNAVWTLIAANVEELHTNNSINKGNWLDENGNSVMWRGDETNRHDILTWSTPDWMVGNFTCSNWTSTSAEWSAIVWHHDRMWLDESDGAKSWNSSHPSKWCALENLKKTGWDWLIYCFAG